MQRLLLPQSWALVPILWFLNHMGLPARLTRQLDAHCLHIEHAC